MFRSLNFALRAFLLAVTCICLTALSNVAHAQTSCECPPWVEASVKSDRMTERAKRAPLALVIQALTEEGLGPEWGNFRPIFSDSCSCIFHNCCHARH